MRDWINTYGKVRKYQAGGPMPGPGPEAMPPEAGPAPGPGAGGPPDIEAMLAEYAQTRDPQLAVAICDTLVEMMMGAGGGAPEGPGPEAGPAGPPMGRRGMKMYRGPIFRS